MTGWECPTCDADPCSAPGRYCAPGRCYCGHEACHAYASRTPIRHLHAVPTTPVRFTFPPRPEPYDHYMENR